MLKKYKNKEVKLPDFLIIGAAKSATTWLSYYLNQHLDIFMCTTEIHFFSDHYNKGIIWYKKFFDRAQNEQMIGENSNTYLYNLEVPYRIIKLLPDVKLIATLRNPIERAYSGYCMQYRKGKVGSNIEDYLNPKNRSLFVEQGFYSKHISNYLRLFPRKQIKIMLYDDLKKDIKEFCTEVYIFLGVNSRDLSSNYLGRINVRQDKTYPWYLKHIISAANKVPYVELVRRRVRISPIYQKIKKSASIKSIKYPDFTEELRKKLIDYYSNDIMQLEKIIDRDLSMWLRKR